GLKVAIVPQPNWNDDLRDFKKFGKPRYFFGITAGNMDSMVNHYTANKRLRSDDAYTPGNKAGFRPDYATIVYSKIVKGLFPDVPVILGGIEASLRRFTHYDYWCDQLKPSILIDSQADLLVYGMGEKPISQICREFKDGKTIGQIKSVNQTAYLTDKSHIPQNSVILYSHEECLNNKTKYASNFKIIETESNKIEGKLLIQPVWDKLLVVNPQNPPASHIEIDAIYDLPFTYLPHPKYNKKGDIPAYEMIKNSINIHRGCFGGCSFCTISAHQGKFISSRSENSIIKEVQKIKSLPGFNGHITDLGGPSANMYKMAGIDIEICKKCSRPSCIYPSICKNLDASHEALTSLYKQVRNIKDVKKITIGSGIRYDLIYNLDDDKLKKQASEYIHELICFHVSGRLKVAPEHTENPVLDLIRKPCFDMFVQLQDEFNKINRRYKLKQQIIPYFISGLPGCGTQEMAELSLKIKNIRVKPEQVQEFTPTPLTLSTVIYYSGINPYTGKTIKTARKVEERVKQKKFFFWYLPENRKVIIDELKRAGLNHFINKLFPLKK
ncbi:MAG: YgiQ family radical SAM protein, partial [Bacteroidales bacterium]|nr:YgiQ family radical SAM protein [Bacteroidales bacterium]